MMSPQNHNIQQIDITPSPRVLRMLGEIDFKAWQCLAEIIDNSIDSFYELDIPETKTIEISLPHNLDARNAVLKIKDNGRGMELETLGNALKAGFSGNNPVDKMGLFGMGFNISTARLGGRTEIITSTMESDNFYKVIIDFNSLEADGHFIAPVEVLPKKADESDYHGTEVTISKLRKEHVIPLKRRKAKTAERLGKIYGRHLLSNGIQIKYENILCKPFSHCIWDKKRTGESSGQSIPAVIEIDNLIDSRNYCSSCWIWLEPTENACPSCHSSSNVSARERRIKGWLGIQRFFDKKHYGVDLIRNGRVIKDLDKDFFYWDNPTNDDDPELEYPIDGHETKGRIVGELEIDFVPVTHQKDAFIVNSQDWRDVVSVVRGNSPIRPNIAKRNGYAKNDSPLAKLFGAFRTAKASIRNLIPSKPNGSAMITDQVIEDYRAKFYDGIEGYVSDEKWWDLVTASSSSPNTSTNENITGGNPFDGSTGEDPLKRKNGITVSPPPDYETNNTDSPTPVTSVPDTFLSGEYTLDYFKNVSVKVIAQRLLTSSLEHGFSVELKGNELHFTYNPENQIFSRSLLTPADFLINELAFHLHQISHNKISNLPLSILELNLRNKYFPELLPSLEEVVRQINGFTEDAIQHFRKKLNKVVPLDLSWLEENSLNKLKIHVQKARPLESEQINQLMQNGEFISYASKEVRLNLIAKYPEVFFDGKFFLYDSDTIESNLANSLKSDFNTFMTDILWLNENSSPINDSTWKGSVKRLIAWLEIINGWRV